MLRIKSLYTTTKHEYLCSTVPTVLEHTMLGYQFYLKIDCCLLKDVNTRVWYSSSAVWANKQAPEVASLGFGAGGQLSAAAAWGEQALASEHSCPSSISQFPLLSQTCQLQHKRSDQGSAVGFDGAVFDWCCAHCLKDEMIFSWWWFLKGAFGPVRNPHLQIPIYQDLSF
jgi:hypothetical protein